MYINFAHEEMNSKWGRPYSRYLHEWVQKIDLEKWGIVINDPVSIRNFVAYYTKYTSDEDQFNVLEYWANHTKPDFQLENPFDDCEGLNTICCNILFSFGYDARLAVGTYSRNNPVYEGPYQMPPVRPNRANHAYGLLFLPEMEDGEGGFGRTWQANPYILECTDDNLVKELPRIDDHPEYYTWYMGSAVTGRDYFCQHMSEFV